MKKILLDGYEMTDKKNTHNYLEEKFDFPDYYGGNLDALWDMLTSISEPIEIELINANGLVENMGRYGENIIRVFKDVVKENTNIILTKEK